MRSCVVLHLRATDLRGVSVPRVTYDDSVFGTWCLDHETRDCLIFCAIGPGDERGVGITALLLGETVLFFYVSSYTSTSFFRFYFSWSPAPPNCERRKASCLLRWSRRTNGNFVFLCHDSPSAARVIDSPAPFFACAFLVIRF